MNLITMMCNDAFNNCQISFILCFLIFFNGLGFVYLFKKLEKLETSLKKEEVKDATSEDNTQEGKA